MDIYLGQTPLGVTAGLHAEDMLTPFKRNDQITSQKGCNILLSRPQYMTGPVSPHPHPHLVLSLKNIYIQLS